MIKVEEYKGWVVDAQINTFNIRYMLHFLNFAVPMPIYFDRLNNQG